MQTITDLQMVVHSRRNVNGGCWNIRSHLIRDCDIFKYSHDVFVVQSYHSKCIFYVEIYNSKFLDTLLRENNIFYCDKSSKEMYIQLIFYKRFINESYANSLFNLETNLGFFMLSQSLILLQNAIIIYFKLRN